MKRKIAFGVIILIGALVCICGCVSTTPAQIPKHTVLPTTQISKHTVPTTPSVTTLPTKSLTSLKTTAPTPIIKTIIPTQNKTIEQAGTRCSDGEPFVNSLLTEKNVLLYGLNNCEMKKIFPKIANDKNYGIQANPSKLGSISIGEWNTFIRGYKEGRNETSKTIPISSCVNPPGVSPINPNWNFIKISAGLEPGNTEPCKYEILFRFHGLGREIGQSRMNETLYKDQSVLIQMYIPMRTDEMDMFDFSTLEFR